MSEGFDNFEPDDRRLSELESSRVLARRLLAVLSEMLLELITTVLLMFNYFVVMPGRTLYPFYLSNCRAACGRVLACASIEVPDCTNI